MWVAAVPSSGAVLMRVCSSSQVRRLFAAQLVSQGQFAELKLLITTFFPNGAFKASCSFATSMKTSSLAARETSCAFALYSLL